jgi:hypothetical protein
MAWREVIKLSRAEFFGEADGLAIGPDQEDLQPGKEAGIRSHRVDTRTLELTNDFVIEAEPRSTHVLDTVSPASTSSLPLCRVCRGHDEDGGMNSVQGIMVLG